MEHVDLTQRQRIAAVRELLDAVRVEVEQHILDGNRLALVDARDRLGDVAALIDVLDRRPFEVSWAVLEPGRAR